MHVNRLKYASLLFVALACGCATPASISSWKHNVDSYVAEKGDPEALRDVTINNNRRGFAVIGSAQPANSTDANAVLLGHKPINGQPTFIYLVGLVHDEKVHDIRIATVSYVDKKSTWQEGNKDDKALKTYQQYNENLWRQQHPKDKPPGSYTTFPRDADAFDLDIQANQITVTHPASGAKWSLNLAQAAK